MALITNEEELQSFNDTYATRTSSLSDANSWKIIVPFTVIHGIIFVTGIFGNTSTCIIIGRNRSMHTTTNCYLFSLAISDLLLLIFGLPFEILSYWYPFSYPIGHALCITVGLISKSAENVTILTITAFTVERYIAICHPFMPHQHSKLSRILIYIVGIWICAPCFAVLQVMLFGMVNYEKNGQRTNACTVEGYGEYQNFAISSFVFFIVPMSLITVLYVLIGIKLQTSRILHTVKNSFIESGEGSNSTSRYRSGAYQRKIIRMLVAVALTFFLCWAPFHVRRLIAIYGKNLEQPTAQYNQVYGALTFVPGVLYYLFTSINPLLYNIMSTKFRNAFKVSLSSCCSCTDSSPLERTHSDQLASRAERTPAMPLQGSPHPRRLQRVFNDDSQLCEDLPKAQVTLSSCCSCTHSSQLERTHSDQLASRAERTPAMPLQGSPHPRRLQRVFNDDSQLCEDPPQAQSQTKSNIPIANKQRKSWFSKQRFPKEAASSASPESISNSSLHELDQELNVEELATYLNEVNCKITEKT